MKATATSTWKGTWKEGEGTISTQTGIIKDAFYSYSSRFEGTPGGSPEELLGAAHAGCFNQALANNFGMIDLVAESIKTSVTVEFGTGDDGFPAIKSSHITVEAKVPGATEERFQYCAERARTRCTISKIFNIEISMSATLLS